MYAYLEALLSLKQSQPGPSIKPPAGSGICTQHPAVHSRAGPQPASPTQVSCASAAGCKASTTHPHIPPYISELQGIANAALSKDTVLGRATDRCQLKTGDASQVHEGHPDSNSSPSVPPPTHANKLQGGNGQHMLNPAQVEQLRLSSLAWCAASHLHWALWGMVQACCSEINYDYVSYAEQRYEQYLLMCEVLGWEPHM